MVDHFVPLASELKIRICLFHWVFQYVWCLN